MSGGNTFVPDLLRRFVPARHVSNVLAGDTSVRLETNDPSIIEAMAKITALPSQENGGHSYFWRLIRDEETPCGGQEVTILSSGPLSTFLLGVGTMIVVDRERREVLGFIAADVGEKELITRCLPLLLSLLKTPESGVSQ
jgi:hypothetical protein